MYTVSQLKWWQKLNPLQYNITQRKQVPFSLHTHTHTHTHPFNGPFSRTTQVSRYQKGKTNLDFTEARDSEWQWNLLDHMQVCTSLQTDKHTSTPPLSFLQAGCPSCRPTNSVKALKATHYTHYHLFNVICNSFIKTYCLVSEIWKFKDHQFMSHVAST